MAARSRPTKASPAPPLRAAGRKRVAIFVFEGVEVLDAVGPFEVFSTATTLLATRGHDGGYDVDLIAPAAGTVRTSSGIALSIERCTADAGKLDTLVIAGGLGTEVASDDETTSAWIRRTARRARRTASVCTGATLPELIRGCV